MRVVPSTAAPARRAVAFAFAVAGFGLGFGARARARPPREAAWLRFLGAAMRYLVSAAWAAARRATGTR